MNSAAAQPAPDGQKPPTRRRVWIAAAAGVACLIGGAAVWAASSDGTAPATSPTPATTASGMPTAEPQASASPSPAPSPSMVAACAARMVITNEWQGGYQADVTVTARGTITDWTVTLDLGTSTVQDSWNSTLKPGATGAAAAANVDYNGSVAAGAETAFGFTATGEAPADLSAGCSSTAGNVRAGGSGPDETPGDAVGAPPATYTSRSNVNSPADDDWLRTDGNRIVDADGNPVWLTGANWYGFNISQRVFSGLSAANHDDLIDQIASRGINVIRVPISTELLLEWKAGRARVPTAVNQTLNPDLVGKTSLEVFEVFLGDAKDRGVKVILDVHSALADDSGHMAPLWYHGDVSTADFLDAWEWTAERYKGDDTIVGYDLKNEPHGQPQEERRAIWDGSTAQNNWRHAAELAGERILRANPYALIIVEGIEATPKSGTSFASTNNDEYDFGWWGGNLRMADDFPVRLSVAHRLVYSPHDYGPLVYEQPYFQQPFTAASLERDVWEPNWLYLHGDDTAPLLIGEWGGRLGQDARQDTWMRALRDLIVDEHLAHTFWCINPESGDTGGLFTDGWQGWDEEKYALLRPALWQDRDGRFVSLDHVTALPGGVSVAQYYSAGNAPPS